MMGSIPKVHPIHHAMALDGVLSLDEIESKSFCLCVRGDGPGKGMTVRRMLDKSQLASSRRRNSVHLASGIQLNVQGRSMLRGTSQFLRETSEVV